MDVLLPQNPKRTAGCSYYAVHQYPLNLDPNTNTWMVLSEEDREVTSVNDRQPHSGSSDRFMDKCPDYLDIMKNLGHWSVCPKQESA